LVSQRGIEANREKIYAILDKEAPRSVKYVQLLAGRMAALERFVSRSAEKGLPFFKELRSIHDFKWTNEA
jgi:hypothetical protein